jgi:hypothetical protein
MENCELAHRRSECTGAPRLFRQSLRFALGSPKVRFSASCIAWRLPDLQYANAAVLNSLTSSDAQRGYHHAIYEFVGWYCSEPPTGIEKHKGVTSVIAAGPGRDSAVRLAADGGQRGGNPMRYLPPDNDEVG